MYEREVEQLERVGYNRGAAVKIMAKVAYGTATVEQYLFAANDLGLIARLNAEADREAAQRAKYSAALHRSTRQPGDFETLLGFDDEAA